MKPGLRKLTLLAHLTSSVGWLGAVVAFLALAIVAVTSRSLPVVRATYIGMGLVVSYVIVPLAVASFASGLLSSLGTTWGLFRHYWVVIKLCLTLSAVAVLLRQVEPIRQMAITAEAPASSLSDFREPMRPLVHAAGGLLVLLVVQSLGVYKPRGLTRYGWGKQR
ncbi:MAG TPA: hypothetical protein VEY30_13080 [Myxococcaceae bacterium]|nr:hypothetical protein [Myxococcaceae bacterium]